VSGIENTGLGTYTLTVPQPGKAIQRLVMARYIIILQVKGNVAIGTRSLANATAYNYNIAIGDSAIVWAIMQSNNMPSAHLPCALIIQVQAILP